MRKPPVTATPFTYRLARLSSTLQGEVAAAAGRRPINGIEDRRELLLFQIVDGWGCYPLERDVDDAPTLIEQERVLSADVAEESMERGQPYVARGSRVVPLRFELVEKEQHEFDLEQLQGQVNHRFPEVPRGKL